MAEQGSQEDIRSGVLSLGIIAAVTGGVAAMLLFGLAGRPNDVWCVTGTSSVVAVAAFAKLIRLSPNTRRIRTTRITGLIGECAVVCISLLVANGCGNFAFGGIGGTLAMGGAGAAIPLSGIVSAAITAVVVYGFMESHYGEEPASGVVTGNDEEDGTSQS